MIAHSSPEPGWDSCDGRAGTFGWDDVVADYEFTTHQQPINVVQQAARVLRDRGWAVEQSRDPHGGPYLTGRRTLDTVVPLNVVLTPAYIVPGGPIAYWNLTATAPPAGARAGGC
ncbi:MAG TPA: hypothetical protein VHT75_10545 [Acidimicrobiales bacterium]|nr:hypothetical protein [Acidimicrobiales bacterium]